MPFSPCSILFQWVFDGVRFLFRLTFQIFYIGSSLNHRTQLVMTLKIALILSSLLFAFEGIFEKINCTTSDDWNEGHPFRDRSSLTMFVSYAKRRRCGFKVGRITFNTSLA